MHTEVIMLQCIHQATPFYNTELFCRVNAIGLYVLLSKELDRTHSPLEVHSCHG